jgi:hypothetical protein
MEKASFVVMVFPADRSKAGLGPLFKRVMAELTSACGEPPCNVFPDTTAVCMLVNGEFDRITRALETAKAIDTQYLILQAGSPYEARGLSKSVTWLQRHG